MQKMVVKTGFGYIKDGKNNLVTKYVLPPGTHPLDDGHTYVEVEDQAALDAINPETVKEVMTRAIAEVKSTAAMLILEKCPDWKVIRHRDELELGGSTSLKKKEYEALQTLRNNIREASNSMVAEISALKNIESVKAYDTSESNSLWP